MAISGLHMIGRPQKVADVKVVALYEPQTGTIVHTHTVTTLAGGRTVTDKEAFDAAHKHATRLGHDVAKLKATASADRAHAVRPHRIDPATGAFVALPMLELKLRHRPS